MIATLYINATIKFNVEKPFVSFFQNSFNQSYFFVFILSNYYFIAFNPLSSEIFQNL